METRQIPREEILPGVVIHVELDPSDLDLARAKEAAIALAKKHANDPMLLSWYDRREETYSPNVECCGEDRPSWVVYAESRGGNLTVDVNHEDYVFIFYDTQTDPGDKMGHP